LIQDEASPEKIATMVVEILADSKRMADIKIELSKIRDLLGSPGAAERTARLAFEML
jgi:lipid-A-disaccharide synthase